ncbi:hypothetical protein [Actinotignum sp. GS-2025d]|uniref:hypothetical protein n=1 Tax=Actinotignum sp. GS-2025d TaxID=3427277 RepID=UPI003F45E487
MANVELDKQTDEFAAHLQRIGELFDPEFSLSKQMATKGDLPVARLRVSNGLCVRVKTT